MQRFYGGLLKVLKPDLCALLPSNLLQSHQGVRCIGNFFVCAYLDVNVNLVTVVMQPPGGEDVLKGGGIHFLEGFCMLLFFDITNSSLGRALSLIAAGAGSVWGSDPGTKKPNTSSLRLSF